MPTTARGQRTEAAFLDAARKVFAEKGYLNAKITDIAEAAGRSAGSFYNYYDNKEELLAALLEQFSAEILGTTAELPHRENPYENVLAAVRAYWTTYRKYLPEMIGVFQLSMTDPGYAQRWRENRAAGIRRVIEGTRRAQQDGYAADLDTGVLASALVSMLESFCWVWMAAGGDADVDLPDDETAITILAAVWYRTVFFTEPEVAAADGPGGAPAPRRGTFRPDRTDLPGRPSATSRRPSPPWRVPRRLHVGDERAARAGSVAAHPPRQRGGPGVAAALEAELANRVEVIASPQGRQAIGGFGRTGP